MEKATAVVRRVVVNKYFLTLMFVNENGYKNLNCRGYFSKFEDAENFLLENWEGLHEYWNNTAVIESIPEGHIDNIVMDKRVEQVWYYTEDMDVKPTRCDNPLRLKIGCYAF